MRAACEAVTIKKSRYNTQSRAIAANKKIVHNTRSTCEDRQWPSILRSQQAPWLLTELYKLGGPRG